VSGSVEVGSHVVLGGQTGVTGHLRIGDGVQAAGKTAIVRDVPAGAKVGGVPAIEIDQAKRNAMAAMDLYGLVQRVKQLEKELERLRQEAASA
jgi:UDP-3-O-[3-hydroxymyristoyl] glucosamine N-acyltransferase